MTNQLFSEVSVDQQETVAGGFSFNFGNSGYFAEVSESFTQTISDPNGGTTTNGVNNATTINTGGTTFNGFNIPATFLSSIFGGI